jgi:hypothetical protein
MKASQIDSAEANVREALSMYEQMFPGSDSIEIARSRHFLALVLKEKQSYEDAVQMLRSSRSVYRTLSKWIHVAISCREQRYPVCFCAHYQASPCSIILHSTAHFFALTLNSAVLKFCVAMSRRLCASTCASSKRYRCACVCYPKRYIHLC